MKTVKIRALAAVLFALSAFILLGNTIYYASARLSIKSDPYVSEMEMYDIGLTLMENGEPVAYRDYLGNGRWSEDGSELLSDIASFSYGKTYDEKLCVVNSGIIDTYVRVTIYRYWLDKDGNKDLSLDPQLIDLHLTDSDKWIKDVDYSYDESTGNYTERIMLYYAEPLKGKDSSSDVAERTSELFADTLTVDGQIKEHYTQNTYTDDEGYTVVEKVYSYDGKKFCVDVKADAVQTHNAEEAIKSAWGRTVEIADDGTLSLGED